MKTSRTRHATRIPRGLGVRLLDELRHNNTGNAGLADWPVTHGAIDHLSADRLVALYRTAIEQLEAQVAQGDGHPPMRKQEVDLMCRCLLSCRTLADAIRCATEFCAMLNPRAGVLRLEVRDDCATFHMDSLRRTHSSAACLVDLTGVLCYLQLFSWLIGQPLRLRSVFLAHPRRDDAIPLLGLFDVPVSVGEPTYGFTFDAALLAYPVLRQPADLDPFLVDFPFRLVGAPPHVLPLQQQLRGILDAALARELPLPTLSEVAQSLGVSEATLRRRLAAEGTGYHQLREECLYQAAERYLRRTDWSIGRIAGHLGFSCEAAFRRAFLRWSGHAPSHLRRAE